MCLDRPSHRQHPRDDHSKSLHLRQYLHQFETTNFSFIPTIPTIPLIPLIPLIPTIPYYPVHSEHSQNKTLIHALRHPHFS
jgi:hypothetical protein